MPEGFPLRHHRIHRISRRSREFPIPRCLHFSCMFYSSFEIITFVCLLNFQFHTLRISIYFIFGVFVWVARFPHSYQQPSKSRDLFPAFSLARRLSIDNRTKIIIHLHHATQKRDIRRRGFKFSFRI